MEDRDKDLTSEGKKIINQLSIIFRNAQVHNLENMAVLNAIDKFHNFITSLLKATEKIDLEIVGKYFYMNGDLIKVPLEYLSNYDALINGFINREIGGISFDIGLSVNDLKIFVEAYINSLSSDTPFYKIESSLKDIGTIKLSRPLHIYEESEYTEKRKMVKKTYFNAISFTKGMMSKIKTGEKVNIRQAKLLVMSMVNAFLEEESIIIGMTTIKDYDDYTYHHSVNVSILAIAMGCKIGLSRSDIADLGLVAMFHDVGKMSISLEILNKPSAFSEDEWQIMKRHPVSAVLNILKIRGLDSTVAKMAISAFEHHMHYNHTGYPATIYREKLDFYSRIVSIADQYDAMTSSRVYSRIPRPPEKALSIMLENSGTQLDPNLLNLFVNMVGVYPIGTLTLLDSNEMGIVHKTNSFAADRPRVMVMVDSFGNRIQGLSIDLTEKDNKGKYIRTIIKTLDPNNYGISLAEYLL